MKPIKLFKDYDLQKAYVYLLSAYLIAILFAYPYGLRVIGEQDLRIPDFFVLGSLVLGVLLLIKENSIRTLPFRKFFPIYLFLLFEVFYPFIGPLIYEEFSFTTALSGGRMVFLYAPVLIFGLLVANYYSEFDNIVNRILKVSVILNFVYSLIQIAVVSQIFPSFLLITKYLKPFAVDPHYKIIDGFRASGFFINTTGLAVFGIIVLSYFLAKYSMNQNINTLIFALGGLSLVLLSTARAAYVVAFLILAVSLMTVPLTKAIRLGSYFMGVSVLVIVFISFTAGLETFFKRIIRLKDGLANDYSFATRLEKLWPKVLEQAQEFPMGTFIPPTKIMGLIDSGYLTYYSQGKWLFIAALVLMLLGVIYYITTSLRKRKNWPAIFLIYLMIYIVLAMVINIPMRSAIIIFFLLYGLAYMDNERRFTS